MGSMASFYAAERCRKYKVERLFAFGSAMRNETLPEERVVDLHIIVAPIGGHGKIYAYLKDQRTKRMSYSS
jgi:hypothetical protein